MISNDNAAKAVARTEQRIAKLGGKSTKDFIAEALAAVNQERLDQGLQPWRKKPQK